MNYHYSNYIPAADFHYSDHRRDYSTDTLLTQPNRPPGTQYYYRVSSPPPYMGPTHPSEYPPPYYSHLLSGHVHCLQEYWASLLYHFPLLYNQGFNFKYPPSHYDPVYHPNNTSPPIHRNSPTRYRFGVSDQRRKRRSPSSRHHLGTRATDSAAIRCRSDSRFTRGVLTVRKAHPRTIRASNFNKQMESPNYVTALNLGNTPPSPLQVSVGRNRDNDKCFKCNVKGHWAANCPGTTPENSRVFPVPVFQGEDGLQYSAPYLICWCGLLCALKSSNSEKNPNRKYYSCLVKHKDGTKFFRWEDAVKKEELLSVPKCKCGAGFCRLYTESIGTTAGIKYFVCPIKKGQGACTFKKLLNGGVLTGDEQGDERISPLRSTLGDCGDISLENSIGDGICGHNGKGLKIMPISGQLQREEPVETESESEEDRPNEPLRKCNNKRLIHGHLKNSSVDSVVEFTNPGSFSGGIARSLNTSQIHIRQVEFSKQISLAGVFPLHDPISAPQIEDRFDRQPLDLQSLQGPPEGSLMIRSISNGIAKLARELGNNLISLLESTDFHKHDIMEREASITFTALDRIQIRSESFRERVKEFIRCASHLDEIGGFMRNDQTFNNLQEQCKQKKRKRDDFSHDYAVAKSNLEAVRERHRTLSEDASRPRDEEFEVEANLFGCVVEAQYNENRCAQISKVLEESEQELKVALQAAEEASKLLQQKKEEYNDAEAAYKKARVELRQII